MAIVFAAITPHTPLLLPAVGKEHRELFRKTLPALTTVADDLYAAKPDILLVISPHIPPSEDAFVFLVDADLAVNFKPFGDLTTLDRFTGAVGFGNRLREAAETKWPVVIRHVEALDYGTGVPLHLLAKPLRETCKVMAISCSRRPLEEHLGFGRFLQNELVEAVDRIAILCSADLSHRLPKHAPAGSSPEGKEFDEAIQRIVRTRSTDDLRRLSPSLVTAAGACGAKPIAMLHGALDGLAASPTVLAYEAPYGVGELTATYRVG